MNLPGSIAKLQKMGIQIYVKLAQSFNNNQMIQTTWLSLAEDLEKEAESIKELPQSFWKHLQVPSEALKEPNLPCEKLSQNEMGNGQSLGACFMRILDFEEPLILKVYVPLIRRLRTGWVNQALDFYIIVKAHVARLAHLVEPFSTDPALVRRSTMLLEHFERDVQSPVSSIAAVQNQPRKAQPDSKKKAVPKGTKMKNPIRRKKSISTRAKPMLGKLKVGNRRVQR